MHSGQKIKFVMQLIWVMHTIVKSTSFYFLVYFPSNCSILPCKPSQMMQWAFLLLVSDWYTGWGFVTSRIFLIKFWGLVLANVTKNPLNYIYYDLRYLLLSHFYLLLIKNSQSTNSGKEIFARNLCVDKIDFPKDWEMREFWYHGIQYLDLYIW